MRRKGALLFALVLAVLLVGAAGTAQADPGDGTSVNNSSRVLWTDELGGENYEVGPAFDGQGRVFIATDEGGPTLRGYNYSDGSNVVWKSFTSVSATRVHGPAIHDNTVYMTSTKFEKVPGEAYLFAVYTNGTERWRVNLTKKYGPVNLWYGIQTDDQGNVYFLLDRANTSIRNQTQRWIVSFDENGNERWKTPLWNGTRIPRIVDITSSTVFLSGKNAAMVDKGTGDLLGNKSTPYGSLVSYPRDRDDNGVFYEANYSTNTLYAVNATENFSTKWTLDASTYTNGNAWTVPAAGPGDNVYWFANPGIGETAGDELSTDLVVIDEDTGDVKRTVNLTADAPSKPRPLIREDGRIFAFTNDNELIAANDTAQRWEVYGSSNSGKYQAAFTSPTIGPNGQLYFAYTPDFGGKTTFVAIDLKPKLFNERVAYQGKNTQDLRSMNASGDVIVYDTQGNKTKDIGPVFEFVDGDDLIEVPFVNNNNQLYLVDKTGETNYLTGTAKATRLSVGDIDDDGNAGVFYVNKNDDVIKKEGGEVEVQITNGRTVLAVAGVADFNNDGDRDVVGVASGSGNEDPVYYWDNGQGFDTGAGTDASEGISVPADFDDDGTVEVAVYEKNGKGFNLIDPDGLEATYDPPFDVSQEAMGALEVTGDGVPEVIYVDKNGKVRYYDVVNGTTGVINSSEEATSSTGVT